MNNFKLITTIIKNSGIKPENIAMLIMCLPKHQREQALSILTDTNEPDSDIDLSLD